MPDFSAWNAELYHYGILGMKWGVRRFQNKDGTRTAAGKQHRARLEKMSDSELEQRLKRLRMEKEYRELNKGKVGRTVDYIRGFARERADIKDKKSHYITAKSQQKQTRISFKIIDGVVKNVLKASSAKTLAEITSQSKEKKKKSEKAKE